MTQQISRTAHGDAPLTAAKQLTPAAVLAAGGVDPHQRVIGHTVCVNRPAAELYEFWRDFSNLASFMHDVRSVEQLDAVTSRWIVDNAGETDQWHAKITEDQPALRIAWVCRKEKAVQNNCTVQFRASPTGRGTFVTMTFAYNAPAGTLGRLAAKLSKHDPDAVLRQNMRRFKQLMETGEIATAARYRGDSPGNSVEQGDAPCAH
jgi:uncharacterized membrane protein